MVEFSLCSPCPIDRLSIDRLSINSTSPPILFQELFAAEAQMKMVEFPVVYPVLQTYFSLYK